MATILDGNLIELFMPVILFLFVYALFYGLLSKVKFFSEKQGINAFLALCVSILFLVVRPAGDVIRFFTPWFVVFVFFGLMLMALFMFAGVKHEDIIEIVKTNGAIYGISIAIMIILFLVSFSQVFGPDTFAYPGSSTDNWWDNAKSIIFNPKILGILVILIIAAEAVRQLGFKEDSK